VAAVRHNGGVPGRSVAHIAIGAVVGAFSWTATEYGAHRWLLHGPFGKGQLKNVPLGGRHRAHHAEPLCTSLPARTAGHVAIMGLAAVTSVGLARIAPLLGARAAAAAWSGGYSIYEIIHWNAHHRPARTVWGGRLRERHMRHHFGAPKANLGVTTSFWDRVFSTEAPAAAPTNAIAT